MGRMPSGHGPGDTPHQHGDVAVNPKTVKVTLHLTIETAQRLGIESAMRRISQSAIAEEVLAGYLTHWKLPVRVKPDRRDAG